MNYTEAQLLEQFRTRLAKRGSRGIMGLGRQFRIADDDNSKALNMEEFKKAVVEKYGNDYGSYVQAIKIIETLKF